MKNLLLYRLVVACIRSIKVARIMLYEQGMFTSFVSRSAVDRNNAPIPWFTYPAIEYLKQFDFSDKRVFEYGSGNSSLFWANRARDVVAVESNPDWFAYMSNVHPGNLKLALETSMERYVSSITREGTMFDLIVIDGQWRNACLRISPEFLVNTGMIIVDNSDRHYEGCVELRKQGFFQIDFSGFIPIKDYTSTTSIFIKCPVEMQNRYFPPDPIGGLRERAFMDD